MEVWPTTEVEMGVAVSDFSLTGEKCQKSESRVWEVCVCVCGGGTVLMASPDPGGQAGLLNLSCHVDCSQHRGPQTRAAARALGSHLQRQRRFEGPWGDTGADGKPVRERTWDDKGGSKGTGDGEEGGARREEGASALEPRGRTGAGERRGADLSRGVRLPPVPQEAHGASRARAGVPGPARSSSR